MAAAARTLIYILIYAGAALMVVNIVRYGIFMGRMRWMRVSVVNRLMLNLPMLLLVLFLAGYLAVALIGSPDAVIAAILFGGSVFVSIILSVLYYIVARVRENERRLSEAQQASRAKSLFLSNMSHDIRTPLNAILGYARLAERPSSDAAQMRGYLKKISSSGEHLLALINDVLEMSRIESGKLELAPERTDLTEVMNGLCDLFGEQMREKDIRFTVSCDSVTDSVVQCDRMRLERVLLNLVSNAYKFTPSGGSVTVSLKQTGKKDSSGRYELRVKDTGIGMSEEFAARIFDAFERERTSTVSGIQGTGLGMSICKSIVDLMGGTIDVRTAQGEGTEFSVCLTLPIDGSPGTKAPAPCSCEGRSFRGMRLLLAEDNAINREIAVMLLGDMGFETDTAENGRLALEKVAASEPGTYGAVLMDVQMPEMGGLEAAKRIRALPDPAHASIPIIAMTANAFAEDIRLEQEAGMDGHISKPIDLNEMTAVLADVLGRDRRQKG